MMVHAEIIWLRISDSGRHINMVTNLQAHTQTETVISILHI